MAYVIAAPCVADYSCVEVCPVDCISPGPDDGQFEDAEQMFIDPDRCIDCGLCYEACPVLAIFSEDKLPEKWQPYAQINRQYFAQQQTGRTRR